MESKKILLAIFFFGIIYGAFGHSYVTSPITRSNQKQSNTGCRGPNCLGPCDAPLSRKFLQPTVVSRGQSITIEWPRNNHAGGFIRFAWAPTSQSDSHAAFDNNVQQINCHEVGGCRPDDASNPNGGDSGPADGSTRACKSTFTVPPHLADGEWTLQWAWFGGAFSLGDYFSCVDYKIVGGANGTFTPTFIGGDYTYPNQPKCKFFNTDELHKCINEPCNNPKYPAAAERSGAPAFIQQNVASTGAPVSQQTPVTTGSATPVTSGLATPVTTGSATPRTTGVVTPMTTGSVPAMTTGTPVSESPTPSVGSCVSSILVGTSSKAVPATVDTWNGGKNFRMVLVLLSQETKLTNWIVEAVWPSSTIVVDGAYNGGKLECQANGRASIRPSGSWSNNVMYGSVQTIEIVGHSSIPLDSQTIMSTTFIVFAQQ